jgi:hypothetical protein
MISKAVIKTKILIALINLKLNKEKIILGQILKKKTDFFGIKSYWLAINWNINVNPS